MKRFDTNLSGGISCICSDLLGKGTGCQILTGYIAFDIAGTDLVPAVLVNIDDLHGTEVVKLADRCAFLVSLGANVQIFVAQGKSSCADSVRIRNEVIFLCILCGCDLRGLRLSGRIFCRRGFDSRIFCGLHFRGFSCFRGFFGLFRS